MSKTPPSKPIPPTRVERKASDIDGWVKNHLANARKEIALKNSELKDLRLARDARQRKGPPERA